MASNHGSLTPTTKPTHEGGWVCLFLFVVLRVLGFRVGGGGGGGVGLQKHGNAMI